MDLAKIELLETDEILIRQLSEIWSNVGVQRKLPVLGVIGAIGDHEFPASEESSILTSPVMLVEFQLMVCKVSMAQNSPRLGDNTLTDFPKLKILE